MVTLIIVILECHEMLLLAKFIFIKTWKKSEKLKFLVKLFIMDKGDIWNHLSCSHCIQTHTYISQFCF